MIPVEAQRLCANGEKVPEGQRGVRLRGYLWITPGCLVEGRGPVYRTLDAYLMLVEGPLVKEQLGDTRTVVKQGAMLIYGTESIQLGGGYMPKPQIWACRPMLQEGGSAVVVDAAGLASGVAG